MEWYGRRVFGEGAKDNPRGRVCSPWMLRALPYPSLGTSTNTKSFVTLLGLKFIRVHSRLIDFNKHSAARTDCPAGGEHAALRGEDEGGEKDECL